MATLYINENTQTFSKLRLGNFAYVDKTQHVLRLASRGGLYFLSRPRRFGKSLFISTLESFFEGHRKLFEGLAIDRPETDWEPRPVLLFDFNTVGKEQNDIDSRFETTLSRYEKQYGLTKGEQSYANRFEAIILSSYEQSNRRQVVILVDEYDKPLINHLESGEDYVASRDKLKPFYNVLKTCDKYIYLAFITGVTRFSKVSIFSSLNNLTDISLLDEFSTVCGFTENELRDTFDGEIERIGAAHKPRPLTKTACYRRMKTLYDGYLFSPYGQRVYNPFSVVKAVNAKQLKKFWDDSGKPTFLVDAVQRLHMDLTADIFGPLPEDSLADIDNYQSDPRPLLYQAGYLTIASYNAAAESFTMRFPNEEVKKGFLQLAAKRYMPLDSDELDRTPYMDRIKNAVVAGDPHKLMNTVRQVFETRTYDLYSKRAFERDFRNTMHLIFQLLGFDVSAEERTQFGRIDCLVKTRKFIYLFEFKLEDTERRLREAEDYEAIASSNSVPRMARPPESDPTAQEAMSQIESSEYARKFQGCRQRLFLIGAGFSSLRRGITGYVIREGGGSGQK